MTSKVPCRYYAQGYCARGTSCTFMHEDSSSRKKKSEPAAQAPALPKPAGVVLVPKASGAPEVAFLATATNIDKSSFAGSMPSASTSLKAVDSSNVIEERDPDESVLPSQLLDDDDDDYMKGPTVSDRPQARGQVSSSYIAAAKANAPPIVEAVVAATTAATETRRLCPFHIEGYCKFGDGCKYIHGNPCEICGRRVLHPTDEEEANMHLDKCKEKKRREMEKSHSSEHECAICYENVLERGRRFGLLPGCDHSFCLECIRSWRGNYDAAKNAVRGCPVCRVESHVVLPSDRMVTGQRKAQMMEEYKQKLQRIPCRHFNFGEGTCPFGTSCFYAHLNKDGTPVEMTARLRGYVDSEGTFETIRDVKLSDFLFG